MSFRASLKNLIRRDPSASLRERAADLQARIPAPKPTAEALIATTQPAAAFAEQVAQAGASHDVLATSGIDHRDGTVSYCDATGRVSRRPMASWLNFNAQQMHSRVQGEMGRRRVLEANHLSAEEYAAWEARIRRELRSDAVHALAFRHDRAFEAAQAFRTGAEPATQALREQGDTELLALAPAWEAAVDLYQQRMDEENAVCEAASDDGWPGRAPEGSGPEWRAWFQQKEDWRERTGVAAAEEASTAAGTALHEIEVQIAELPAASLAGLKLKARVAQRSDDIDVDWPEGLGEGLTRDLLAFTAQPAVDMAAPASGAAAAPTQLASDITALWHEIGTFDHSRTDEKANAEFEALVDRKIALLAAAEALPATPATVGAKALALAWDHLTDEYRADRPRDDYETAGRLALDIDAAMRQPAGSRRAAPYAALVDMIDLASASLDDLQSLHDLADAVGTFAYALVWTGRCKARGPGDHYNAAGKLMQWLGDALTDVETAANNEARRRRPANRADRETRLEMLALPVVQNGDPDEAEAFARELLAHADAERSGR